MARRRRNPFYALLGLVGFAFTITAVCSCLGVLRGVRPETVAVRGTHPIEWLLDRHGTSILVGELVILAIATVGAVAVDHVDGERERLARDTAHGRPEAPPSAGEP